MKWQKTWAVRQGDWKLTNTNENHWKSEPSVQYIAPIVDNLELKLFNVETDPGERFDVSKQFPEKVKALETAYLNWCEANIQKQQFLLLNNRYFNAFFFKFFLIE